jgi:hypothetical protein
MLRMRMRALLVSGLALVGIIASGAMALASNSTRPTLKAPHKGQAVHAGTIRLVVYEPGLTDSSLYVAIRRQRKLDRNGYLAHNPCDVSKGCDFITLQHWHGHRGYWVYTAGVSFPGYWATTPGRYYWQASIVAPSCQAKGCEIASAIHTFKVVG